VLYGAAYSFVFSLLLLPTSCTHTAYEPRFLDCKRKKDRRVKLVNAIKTHMDSTL